MAHFKKVDTDKEAAAAAAYTTEDSVHLDSIYLFIIMFFSITCYKITIPK